MWPPHYVSLSEYPNQWIPEGNYHDLRVERLLRGLAASDFAQYNSIEEKESAYGRSVFRVLREWFQGARTPLSGVTFGAVLYTDPTGVYTRFYEAFFRLLLQQAAKRSLPIGYGTGGGPGFAMEETARLFRQAAENVSPEMARLFSVLVKIGREAPSGVAEKDLTIRAQEDLSQRGRLLLLMADYVFVTPGGLGTEAEASQVGLDNQLMRRSDRAPVVTGAKLMIHLDSNISNEVCSKAGLPEGTRVFDPYFQQMKLRVAMGTVRQEELAAVVRIQIDEDPDQAARQATDAIFRWHQLREESGAKQAEVAAIAAALKDI